MIQLIYTVLYNFKQEYLWNLKLCFIAQEIMVVFGSIFTDLDYAVHSV